MRFATISTAFLVLLSVATNRTLFEDEPPSDWIDPATGHRTIRLSQDAGTASLYFHQNAYTDRGDKLFVTITASPPASEPNLPARQTAEAQPARGRQGGSIVPPNVTLATIDLTTLGKSPPKIDKMDTGPFGGFVVGKKSRSVYYTRSELVDGRRVSKAYSTNLDTHATREIGTLPIGRGGSGLAINADETLLGGSYIDLPPQGTISGDGNAAGKGNAASDAGAVNPSDVQPALPLAQTANGAEDRRQQEGRLAQRFAQRLPMKLYTIAIQTGEVKTFNPSTDWENNVQFSPTDPSLMMFCHEGPWHDVDRVWTIHVPDGQQKLMHARTMKYEIAGHEFFGHDGKWIWYDLQTPRSDKFWLAGVNVENGDRIRYPIDRVNWSVHYNESYDGKLFAGDGGGPESVANRTPLPENKKLDSPGNGQWIYLFRPQPSSETLKVDDETVKIGKFTAERLADLSKHNYNLEPNLTFSPDNKWIIFRSNMHGPTHVYAVEVAKAE